MARERLALDRGAALRSVYPAAALRRPAVLAHVRELTGAGARIRVAHSLPLRLIVVDARLAVLPAPGDLSDEVSEDGPDAAAPRVRGRAEAAVVVREPALVALVAELFEYFWSAASTPPELHPGAAGRTDRHDVVLRLLAAGLTDAAIARKLEVSERTVRRLVAELTADLGAESRFQAGCPRGPPRPDLRPFRAGRPPVRGAQRRPGTGRPRWSRRVVPVYSVRNTPRSWSRGTTWSTKSSRPPGVRCGTRMKPSAASFCT